MGRAHVAEAGSSGSAIQEQAMPFIRITAAGPILAPEQVSRLQIEVTELMTSVLGKNATLTSVLVEQPAFASWAIGRIPATVAVHVDATITAGTNSPEEKARFIERTMRLLKNVFGAELNPATYIVIAEVPAQSWGYDGRTQESRRPQAA
jgi:4-oxalocrotonate tautomerase